VLGLLSKVCRARSEIRTTICGPSAVTVSSLWQGKAKIDHDPRGFKLLYAPSAEALAQLVDDFEPAPGPNRWRSRSIVGDATFRKCADAQQLDANLAFPARESMPCRIVYQLEHDHSEPPTMIHRQLVKVDSSAVLVASIGKLLCSMVVQRMSRT